MLLSTETELKWTNRIKTHYVNKGYIFTKINDVFTIKTEDLTDGSHALVNVRCDCEDCNDPYLKLMTWRNYLRSLKDDGKFYCRLCSLKLYGGENSRQTKLENSTSFAQWGIDNLGDDFLDKYWDYERNEVDPWEISYGYTINKVWIKCQEKQYHGSYDVACSHFTHGKRCSYCGNKKIHPLDSLGTMYPNSLDLWSNKNNKSPYEYSHGSGKEVYWKCHNGVHKDFERSIHGSSSRDFRCPDCQFSEGEKIIEEYLNTYEIYYTPQKEFDGLIGLKGGNLSYDFYLPKYNLLIEYQGKFHDNDGGNGTKYMKEKFPRQQEHDKRKKEYAKNNNINLLEIWYYDFDNIETILHKYLLNLKEVS